MVSAGYPSSVWDGLSSSRLQGQYSRPSPEDWDQIVAELLATQGELGQYAIKTLTSAQLLACKTTPIEIIPAPGSGKAIIVDQVIAKAAFESAAYAYTTVANLAYTDITGTIAYAFAAAFLESTADALAFGNGSVDNIAETALDNAPIVFNAPDADPTTGDGTLYLAVRYRVIDIP